jgi:putative SOS response-associated peptidase YedK
VCGRFTRFTPAADIAKTFSAVTSQVEIQPSYNIAPTRSIYVVKGGVSRAINELHWGLVPAWSKDISRASSMINARVESVREKPSFRNLLASNRCVIPVNGYYEWKQVPVKGKVSAKQPFYFSASVESEYCHDGMLAIAGLWTTWGNGEELYSSCTALTMEATERISIVHHRMPMLLDKQRLDLWLSDDTKIDLDELAIPVDLQIDIHPVSKAVNNARNDDRSLIELIDVEESEPLSLF